MNENEIDNQMPRGLRTPITEAGSAVGIAWRFWVELVGHLMADSPDRDFGEMANPEEFFAARIFGEAFDDPATDGDKSENEIGLSLDGKRDPNSAPFALLQVMHTVVAYAVQAMKAEKAGAHDMAWTFVSDAKYWSGILNAGLAEKKYGANPAVEMAKKRHAENYALAGDALKYWRENIDPCLSAAKAANDLVRIVPLSHKKLSEIISTAKKDIGKS